MPTREIELGSNPTRSRSFNHRVPKPGDPVVIHKCWKLVISGIVSAALPFSIDEYSPMIAEYSAMADEYSVRLAE